MEAFLAPHMFLLIPIIYLERETYIKSISKPKLEQGKHMKYVDGKYVDGNI